MDIHQSNCEMLGLMLTSRAGGSFRQYLSAFIVIFWRLQILFYSGVKGKINLQWSDVIRLFPFPVLFILLH